MQIIPNQSHDGKETGDCADDEAAINQTEILHILVLFQENLMGKQRAQFIVYLATFTDGFQRRVKLILYRCTNFNCIIQMILIKASERGKPIQLQEHHRNSNKCGESAATLDIFYI